MNKKIRCIHYLNQFFGQVGAEEEANFPLIFKEGPVGPGTVLERALGSEGDIVGTIISGDNYFVENKDAALREIETILEKFKPNLVIAGPAFGAGRYGLACAEVCRLVQKKGISAVTSMSMDNPGVIEHGRELYIFPIDGVTSMKQTLEKVLDFGKRLVLGGTIGRAKEEGYMPRGIRVAGTAKEVGYKRAVDMLVKKLRGESFKTEIPVILPNKVNPAKAIKDLSKAKIALITTCGLIPKGNPDDQVSRDPDRYHSYSTEGMTQLETGKWEAFHSGYFCDIATNEPNYIVPLRQIKVLESQNMVGSVHPIVYSLAGVNGAVANAIEMGRGLAAELKEAKVDGVLLTAA